MRSARVQAGLAALLLATLLPACAADRSVAARDRAMLATDIVSLAPQRPGKVDLYVVGFAGDSTQNVFRNEVEYLNGIMATRFAANRHVITLVNHLDSLTKNPRPLATLANLRIALSGIGRVMDDDEDILLLYLTMHGTKDHVLYVELPPVLEQWITPRQLRRALDDAGIRNRVVVISACYSGGFIPALRDARTMVITAARADRASFGCGAESEYTYFGHAWLVDGLDHSSSFLAAYEAATKEVAQREHADDFEPSLPQIDIGSDILPRLQRWQRTLPLGLPVLPSHPH